LTDELGRINTKVKAKLDEDRKKSVAELNRSVADVQREIANRLGMRFTPKVHFFYDTGFEHAVKVESILRKIELERK
jgi:ribosome-binding factor A